jgi:hypothetical protein
MSERLDPNQPLPEWRPSLGERDPARIDVLLGQLAAVWKQYPDMRLGQLVVNLLDPAPNPIFNVEDHTLSQKIVEHQRTGRWPTAQPPS